jgi:metallo-beta-lactamase class B
MKRNKRSELSSVARMSIWLALAFSVAVALAIAGRGATPQEQTDPLHGQHVLKPFRLIGNIYYVGLSENTSFLITTPEGNMLLDPTYDAAVPYIAKNIEQLGFKVKDTKFILQAHAHTDHVEGLARLKELTGAKILVMSGDEEVIADGGKSDFRSDGRQLWKPVRADRILQDKENVRLGGVTMVAHRTAGHTKGCTSWTTTVDESGRKHNVVFICSLSLNDRVPLVGNKKYPAIADDYKKSFSFFKNLSSDVFLVSHTRWFNMDEKLKRMAQGSSTNPFIDPEGYRAYIAEREQAFVTQLQKDQAKP